MKYTDMLDRNNKVHFNQKVNLTVITNLELEPYFKPCIKNAFNASRIEASAAVIDYMEFLNGRLIELNFHKTDLYIIWINTELLDNYNLEPLLDSINSKLSSSNVPAIWMGIEDYYTGYSQVLGNSYCAFSNADKLNLYLNGLLNTNRHDNIIDLKRIIAAAGIEASYDFKCRYRWNSPYSFALMNLISLEILKQYKIYRGITKKCIVLDCDNVLWGGVVSEDGIEGIELGETGKGAFYRDFQKLLVIMRRNGIILTVCSKNDEADVFNVFRHHDSMQLKEEDISVYRIGWENKASAIASISETLGIGLESIVFIDDSEYEINLVNEMLPDVEAVLFDKNIYSKLDSFNISLNGDSREIEKRFDTYKTDVKRAEFKRSFDNIDDYISELNVEINIEEAKASEFNRISELSQRTNRMTNGSRYDLAKLKEALAANDFKLFSVKVKDRFSDLGLVGAIGVYTDHKPVKVDLFCLSCRALGRKVENRMFDYLYDKFGELAFTFIDTGKNGHLEPLMIK